ncbi:MAG: endolytic transglycosylase MltG [Pseudanabaenales cyanobacterium]|nr:endolytic transglycosylase MltG [Pseudanabaenales cyanobacterium]
MKSGLWKGLFYLVLLPAAMAVSGWQGWTWWSWATSPIHSALANERPSADKTMQIQIPQGTPAQQIGQDLESAGLIRSSTAWNLWTRWRAFQDPKGGFQAGVYALSPTQTLTDIANQIWLGEVVQLSFTIPEGWSRQQMAEALEAKGFFPASAFMDASSKIPVNQYPWLPQNIPHLEGFLYPDTYQLPAEQITPEAVVFQMLNRFEQKAFSLYQQQPTVSLLEWVTLASIVEKEAVVPEERGIIAGVFANRLENSIPLGADPTVEYGLGIEQTPEQPLTFDQVNTPSPYNTYINPGLPPTPIASPGQASLEAALKPEKTDYLYFVARYDGTHVFSRTLAEHEAAQADIRDRIDSP